MQKTYCRNIQKSGSEYVIFSTCYEFQRNFVQIFGNFNNLQIAFRVV